jgi:hypothetical protein
MQGQDTQKSNVVSLFSARKKEDETPSNLQSSTISAADEESFADVMARNMKNQERMAKERANANKSVLRSYRIKH